MCYKYCKLGRAAMRFDYTDIMLTLATLVIILYVLAADAQPLSIENIDVDDFPGSYTQGVNKFYVISDILTANWHSAERVCVSKNMRLASVTNQRENDELASLMYTNDVSKIWIGATDLAEEGRFYWVSDGAGVQYPTRWDAGQPDNYMDNENCVTVTKEGAWNDEPCDFMYHFACEKYVYFGMDYFLL